MKTTLLLLWRDDIPHVTYNECRISIHVCD